MMLWSNKAGGRKQLAWSSMLGAVFLGSSCTRAIEIDFTNNASVIDAARIVAAGMMNYYTGNLTGQTPGNLPDPYYWWEAGAAFGALIDYYYYTGNTEYVDVTTQAMLWQVGNDNAFMPPNQTKTEGNDDQAFWGMAALSAAENKFPDPPSDQPQWLALAQGVFNSQVARWDNATCGGGLRWQIFTFNNGYNYKNSISNGCFFNIAARLAVYTKNQTYADWAEKMWDWVSDIGLLTDDYYIYDGSDTTINCTTVNHLQWTYNAGTFLLGAANMYNLTGGSDKWRARVEGILNATSIFFSSEVPNVMYEVACEPGGTCNTDQKSFKAYLARWMAATTKMAPFTTDYILPKLLASAKAAAQSCSGGADGVTCGLKWTTGGWDGSYGVGQQMSALEVIQSNLIANAAGPADQTSGTSQGDITAGTGSSTNADGTHAYTVTTGDKAGAGFLTAVVLVSLVGTSWWMMM